MLWTGLVGPALRAVASGITTVAGKADATPTKGKTVDIATLIGLGAGYLGLDADTRAALGKLMVLLGQALGG